MVVVEVVHHGHVRGDLQDEDISTPLYTPVCVCFVINAVERILQHWWSAPNDDTSRGRFPVEPALTITVPSAGQPIPGHKLHFLAWHHLATNPTGHKSRPRPMEHFDSFSACKSLSRLYWATLRITLFTGSLLVRSTLLEKLRSRSQTVCTEH